MEQDNGHATSPASPMPDERAVQAPDLLISKASAGSMSALGRLLERYRDHLRLVAEREIDPRLRAKLDASDIVQETFLDARKSFAQFRASTEAELFAWLRALLRNNVLNSVRHYRETDKRELDREVLLNGDSSADALTASLATGSPTPGVKAARREQVERIEEAVGRLSDEYQTVVRLRLFENRPFAEIAASLGTTEGASRALFYRALARLKIEIGDLDGSSAG